MKHIAYILIAVLMFPSCVQDQIKGEKQIPEQYHERSDITMIEVRGCEYVLWTNGNGYGGDLEHYEGCDNPEHKDI